MSEPRGQEAQAPQNDAQTPVTDMRQLRKQRALENDQGEGGDASPQPLRRPKVSGSGPQIGGGIGMALLAMIAVGVLNRQCSRPSQQGASAAASVRSVAQAHGAMAAMPVSSAKRQAAAS